jgi:signal transduction histidine kinase
MEKRYIRKDTSIVWINLTVSLVSEHQGKPKYFISIIEDITERKQLESARQKQIEQERLVAKLQQVNQLKDDFLSTVSHELRTPLTNMKMALSMLKSSPTVERQQRYMEILQAECNREIELLNDLLDLQRLEVAPEPFRLVDYLNLQEMLPNIILPFRARMQERQLSLQINLPPDLPPLVSHRASWERILAELLNNACKYTRAGGAIILSVCYKSTDAATRFTIRACFKTFVILGK